MSETDEERMQRELIEGIAESLKQPREKRPAGSSMLGAARTSGGAPMLLMSVDAGKTWRKLEPFSFGDVETDGMDE